MQEESQDKDTADGSENGSDNFVIERAEYSEENTAFKAYQYSL